ncbi:hypothetical protein [Cytobacillus praedii]|uniref:hypothetical protein n=1 Tax=Cytobacillus praedii TaxID=1742358 RepID=UPI0013F4966C|nr:hypothetical protein [Cytobacillus praedii]
MSAEQKIEKAIQSCMRALETRKENKRLSVGDLDYAKEYILAAIHLSILEIEEEEGKF